MIEIDVPDVHRELNAALDAYEQALASNDIATVNAFFWNNPLTLRYGTRDGECHYSYDELATFRVRRGAVNQPRTYVRRRVTTYGHDFGTTNIEYQSPGSDKIGRQSQSWVRTGDGWKIVSAHVSFGT